MKNNSPNPFEQLKEKIIERQKILERESVSSREVINQVVEEEIEKGLKNLPAEKEVIIPPKAAIKIETDDEKAAEKRIEELTKIALEQSVPKAVELTRKTSQAYLIDRFHDVLADRLYEELVKEGKIKEIK